MDAYPEDYVVHNLPFILLSGLDAGSDGDQHSDYPLLYKGDATIDSDFPPLTGPTAEQLRQAFLEEDASRAPWERRNENRAPSSGAGYKIKSVGRSYRLPPRKADPPPVSPPTSPNAGPDNGGGHGPHFVLHSPISPLTPSSPTFPDGLLTPLWVTKHQGLVPAVVINFFPFCQDPNMNSLRDNQLKIEINGLKKQWSSSGYKTRFLVVLLSEENSGAVVEEAEERIASIRRATNMDQKSIFLLPADATPTELKEFVTSLESLLHPAVMDYYRDLSKHARRKRNRSAIPPPTAPPTSGTSQTLSLQGWNVRYEFKLGVFAEFRQETDAALRNYESAYETLFGQEVFENIPGWSPRFNDARLLADSLAIRIIRCLLRCGQPAAAVRSWNNHRRHSQGVINRRGKGTNNYGWEAWEARWSMVMAQLIHQAEISYFTRPGPSQDQASEQYSIYVPREKAQPQHGIIQPWEHLHHEGYWLCRSAKHTMYRRELAEKIPVEDRIPPGQSPASQIASKSYLYDTYLVPETHVEAPQAGRTGFDHSPLIIDALKAALEEFSKRGQIRKTELVSLEIAEEYMRAGSWVEAYDILRPLWATLTWRRSGWWQLMEKFGWALRECAFRVHDSGTILQVDWELLNRAFHEKPNWEYDIHKSLGDLPSVKPKPSIVLNANDVIPSVTASFVFAKSEGNVGEPLQGQLAITSHTQASSKPIRFSEVKVVFEGCLRPIKLQSDQNTQADTASSCIISSPTLRDSSTTHDGPLQSPTSWLTPLVGMADLSIGPSQTKIFDLRCIPREAGDCSVASVTLSIEEDKFDLACAIADLALSESYWWQQTSKGPSRRRVGQDREINRCKVNPKPPKIRITTPNLKATYYTNERVVLKIGIHNEEEEAANVQAEARLFGPPESAAKITWLDEDASSESEDSEKRTLSDSLSHLVQRRIGVMERSTQRELAVVLSDTDDASDHELEISAVYNLVSDVQTPVIATTRVKLTIIRPFEANYDFLPRIHPQPWPDFFTASEDPKSGSDPAGLQQRWCLNSKVVSFALEPLIIERMTLVLLGVGGGAVCDIGPETIVSPEAPEIQPEELRESNFQMDLHKTTLGDRRATAVSLQLEIQWRRSDTGGTGDATDSSDGQVTATSTLAVPRFVVPVGEPRVLASSIASKNLPGLIHLDYTLENPSMHFLTFNLAMEANENFAFSGPKTVVVQLVPLSRHTVRYNLLASKRGLWIQPQLLVVDTYFNKTLRVLPTEDMQSDKKGPLVWVDADD